MVHVEAGPRGGAIRRGRRRGGPRGREHGLADGAHRRLVRGRRGRESAERRARRRRRGRGPPARGAERGRRRHERLAAVRQRVGASNASVRTRARPPGTLRPGATCARGTRGEAEGGRRSRGGRGGRPRREGVWESSKAPRWAPSPRVPVCQLDRALRTRDRAPEMLMSEIFPPRPENPPRESRDVVPGRVPRSLRGAPHARPLWNRPRRPPRWCVDRPDKPRRASARAFALPPRLPPASIVASARSAAENTARGRGVFLSLGSRSPRRRERPRRASPDPHPAVPLPLRPSPSASWAPATIATARTSTSAGWWTSTPSRRASTDSPSAP